LHELIALIAIAGTASLGSQMGLSKMTATATFYGGWYFFVKLLSLTSQGSLALALEDPY
jgi:hypothetical protein